VYLSTAVDVPDSVLLGTTPDNRWIGASLQGGTTYYWRVVARNDAGETAGPAWSFTTAPWEAMTPQEETRETPAGPALCPVAGALALSLTLLGMRVARAGELPGRRRAR
jgi:hypothetical protein